MSLPRNPARWPYLIGGYALFILGGLGLVLPLLPTTVFWIGAAACFAKSSPVMYRRLINRPKIGPIIHDFLAFGVISTGAKKASLIGMGLCAVVIAVLSFGTLAMAFSWGGIGFAAAIVLSRPSQRSADQWYINHGQRSCPFLARVHIPFPMSHTAQEPAIFLG